MSNDIESLKPCPDCGRTPKVQDAQTLSGDIWNIVCYRCNIETGVCKSYREAVENWNATVTAHSDDGEPVPRHRCNGVNGGERHGTSNKCNICGEYREGWFDENGFPIVPLDLQAEPARPDEGDKVEWKPLPFIPDVEMSDAERQECRNDNDKFLASQVMVAKPLIAHMSAAFTQGYVACHNRLANELAAERTHREAYEEMVAQAYRIEFTDYERIIEKYGDENSKTGIVWQVEDENNQRRFSKHGTALEAFKQIQKATKDESI